jgi:hypothetical protein
MERPRRRFFRAWQMSGSDFGGLSMGKKLKCGGARPGIAGFENYTVSSSISEMEG